MGKIAEMLVFDGIAEGPVAAPDGKQIKSLECFGRRACLKASVSRHAHFETQKSLAGQMPTRLLPNGPSRLAAIASTIIVAIVRGAQALGPVIVMIAARIDGRRLSVSRSGQAGHGNNCEKCIAKNLGHFNFSSA
ncbi:hypothetical protein AB6802_29390 [Mesorhizobium sp. RCC_202]|uniref:hypothetical protein n=1 Tax=Mesorhizobium sp. RCC_202 TaxID=3239222 RepID=UPI003523BF1C